MVYLFFIDNILTNATHYGNITRFIQCAPVLPYTLKKRKKTYGILPKEYEPCFISGNDTSHIKIKMDIAATVANANVY